MEEERKPKVQFNTTGPDEKKPRLKMGSFGSASSAAIMEGIQAGNINISDGKQRPHKSTTVPFITCSIQLVFEFKWVSSMSLYCGLLIP